MRGGKLDRQVVLQTPSTTQDSTGAPETTYSTFATVWAEVVPLSGREYFAAQQVTAEEQCKFRIRYLAGVTVGMRVVYNGKNFDVQYIAEIGRRQGLELIGKVP